MTTATVSPAASPAPAAPSVLAGHSHRRQAPRRRNRRRDPGAADRRWPCPLREPGLWRLRAGAVPGLRLPQRDPALLRQRPPRRRLRLADQHLRVRERAQHRPRLRGRPPGRLGDLHPQHHRLAEPPGRVPARHGRPARRRRPVPGHRAPRQPAAVAGCPAPQHRGRGHPGRHHRRCPRANWSRAGSACSP